MDITPDNTIVSTAKLDISWIKHHLILLGVVIVLVYGGVYLLESLSDKRATQEDARWQQILSVQQQQTKTLQQNVEAHEQATAQVQAQQQVLIGQLAAAIAQRNVAVQKQQQVDATLSAVDAATRIAQQTNAKQGQITANGDSVVMDLPIARTVVGQLDLLPVVQANLADTQNQLNAETKIADGALSNVDEEKGLRAQLNITLEDQRKACTAQVNKLKADGRKSKLKLVGISYVAGVVSGLLLHIAGL